ncbi:SUMO-activating enzyme subunit 1 isoform X1 [Lingula anatina]|uniref:SUMO-activating enzyme subunit 1 n=1 Tax=Lingula anatina TaxID=7574 RepID=A0A1S3IQQ4_LINAN|nr:SUMO-activating enzyme subunit 1 isoform X1 [Lingula anatina]|eukprot:XP_013400398.1 SUMO-activating enzyme subunit 1 isoform X1 [Lingula anatina]
MVEQKEMNLTEDEAALYDRQIRLWGLDAQKRLRAARVLLIGLQGLGAEISKNIVLAGIKSLTLMDHTVVTEEDACSQFLIPRSKIGENRAEASVERTALLNPMVEVTADSSDIAEKDETFFQNFDVVCATNLIKDQLLRINSICHENKIKFFAGDVFGYHGFMFADLNEHEYAEETIKKKKESGDASAKKAKMQEEETVVSKKSMSFVRLKEALAVDWSSENMSKLLKKVPKTFFIIQVLLKFRAQHKRDPSPKSKEEDIVNLLKVRDQVLEELKISKDFVDDSFASYCFAELSPVCAIVGGVFGQEIIKAVSQKDAPHNNFFFFNGLDGSGMVDCIGNS